MRALFVVVLALMLASGCQTMGPVKSAGYAIVPPSAEVATEYKLDTDFYKKTLMVEGILIATSDGVSDFALLESAYLFEKQMKNLNSEVGERVRNAGVLCILVGHDELTSDIPQFKTDKTGEELDFYNWRKRGFLTRVKKRPVVLFAEEDVLEYKGGARTESILIHEFGHVVHHAGFDKTLQKRLTAVYNNANEKKLWRDGYAAQFYRLKSEEPVDLVDGLAAELPDHPRELFEKAVAAGDILVDMQPVAVGTKVTKKNRLAIVFGGPKSCYAALNRNEYFAEVYQTWYDTNRLLDHDHNHVTTRQQLKNYDEQAAALVADVLGPSNWRFVSPRKRAGSRHLSGFDPKDSPERKTLPHIRAAAHAHFMKYWNDYWPRLYKKHRVPIAASLLAGQGPTPATKSSTLGANSCPCQH